MIYFIRYFLNLQSIVSASSPIDISGRLSRAYSSPINTAPSSPLDLISAKLAEASSKPSSFDRKIEQYLSNNAETGMIEQIKKVLIYRIYR